MSHVQRDAYEGGNGVVNDGTSRNPSKEFFGYWEWRNSMLGNKFVPCPVDCDNMLRP